MKLYFFFLVFSGSLHVAAQSVNLKVGGGQGANTVIRDSGNNKIGNSNLVGVKASIVLNESVIHFKPSLNLLMNTYKTIIRNKTYLVNNNTCVNLNVMGGLPLKQNIHINVGFFINYHISSNIKIVKKSNLNYNQAYNYEDLYRGYFPKNVHAGIIIGFETPIGKEEKVFFDIQVMQYATSIVSTNYYLSSLNKDQIIYSDNTFLTVFALGVYYKISLLSD